MPISEHELLESRPCAYHTCSAGNFPSIVAGRKLLPAGALLANSCIQAGIRRSRSLTVSGPHGEVVLRDHQPFAPGAVEFESGTNTSQYIEEQLDGRGFFWPGTSMGPFAPGGSTTRGMLKMSRSSCFA